MVLKFIKRAYMVIITASILYLLCSCAKPVNALDYKLENTIQDDIKIETYESYDLADDSSGEYDMTFICNIKVNGQDGESLQGARVTLYGSEAVEYSAVTDNSGAVSWNLPGEVPYAVKVECDGYESEYEIIYSDYLCGEVMESFCLTAADEECGVSENYNETTTYYSNVDSVLNSDIITINNDEYKELINLKSSLSDRLTSGMNNIMKEFEELISELAEDENNVRYMKKVDINNEYISNITTTSYVQTEHLSVSNWSDIISVYIVKNGYVLNDYTDFAELYDISFDGLDEVFWDMVSIDVLNTEDGIDVLIDCASYEDMADAYSLDTENKELLSKLMMTDFKKILASVTGNAVTSLNDTNSLYETLSGFPDDLSAERRNIVETACSMIGRISYFWGGKYDEEGWNPGWELPRVVTSMGSVTTGKIRPYGMDCSGFVSWVYINALGIDSFASGIGNDTYTQWYSCNSVEWDDAMPGDLVFYAKPGSVDTNHVGIVVKAEEGSLQVIHLTAGENTVIISDAAEEGLIYVRRPKAFE